MSIIGQSEPRKLFFVLTGCSGGGKSSLLDELGRRGYSTVPEPGREIVREQLAHGGNALPWQDAEAFMRLLLQRYVDDFDRMNAHESPVFFDRSLVEAVSHYDSINQSVSYEVRQKAKGYSRTVFVLPPWKEIFIQDEERRHSFEDALAEYNRLIPAYESFNYETITLPKFNVRQRADFVVERAATGRTEAT